MSCAKTILVGAGGAVGKRLCAALADRRRQGYPYTSIIAGRFLKKVTTTVVSARVRGEIPHNTDVTVVVRIGFYAALKPL